jgi:hypothetical protein
VLLLPAVRDHIEKGGMTTVETPSVEVLRAFVASEIARWGDVVKKAGLAGSTVTLKLKSEDFKIRTRARSLPHPKRELWIDFRSLSSGRALRGSVGQQ